MKSLKNKFKLITLIILSVIAHDTMISQCITTLTPSSTIVSEDDQILLSSWLPSGFQFEANLVYESAESGSLASSFHSACDGLSNTVLIAVTTEGNIIGGYNEGQWSSNGASQFNLDNNFLYSLTKGETYAAIPGAVHITNSSNGLRFGSNSSDLRFAISVPQSVLAFNYLGNSYECPVPDQSDCQLYINENNGWNGLDDRFLVDRWEIWQLNTSGTALGQIIDSDGDGVCDGEEIVGCQNPLATNYDNAATDSGVCDFADNCLTGLTPNGSLLNTEAQGMVLNWLPAGLEYQATLAYDTDDFDLTVASFHAECDGLSNTLVVAISQAGNVFGGYNEGVWSSDGSSQSGLDNNFLFSVANQEYYPAIPGAQHISNDPQDGPDFGSSDLEFNNSTGPYLLAVNVLGNGYECPPGTPANCESVLNEGIGWNGATDRFATVRFQVWQLNSSGTAVGEIIDTDNDGLCDGLEVSGCDDETACNYDPLVTENDGSCELPGCLNALACNYDSSVLCDDGSCILPDGCTDSAAINYCDHFVCDDGSCEYTGCTNPAASNYDANADYDDGSCAQVSGCTTYAACNYNSFATLDNGSCIFPIGCQVCSGAQDGTGTVIDTDADNDGVCDSDEISGCTDPDACNYDSAATEEDGTCTYASELANAGPDIENCHQSGTTNIFNPQGVLPSGFSGLWTVESGNANITVTTQVSPIPQITMLTGQTAVLRWTITDGACVSYDEMTIVNYSNVANANAGPDQSNCEDGNFTMAGNTTVFGTGEWSSNNPNVIIADAADPLTGVSGLPSGESATMTWTFTNGVCSDLDEMTITNYETPTQAVCQEDISQCNNSLSNLIGNVPDVGAGAWSVVSSLGGTLGFGTSVLGQQGPGVEATYRYTITNGDCSTFDEITVTNYASTGNPNAGADIDFCGSEVALNGNLPNAGIGEWTTIAGNVIIDDVNDPNTLVSGLNVGQTAQLIWTFYNGTCVSNQNAVSVTRNVGGCTDNSALNYSAVASCDDGSCQYSDPGFGCTDGNACNYDAAAVTDDGSCTYNFGCTDEAAYNYNSTAVCDDDSCVYPGCMDPLANNFMNNPMANFPDDSCTYAEGCTYTDAPNYDSNAVKDDGSCVYSCFGDANGDGVVSAGDLTGFLAVFGSTCELE